MRVEKTTENHVNPQARVNTQACRFCLVVKGPILWHFYKLPVSVTGHKRVLFATPRLTRRETPGRNCSRTFILCQTILSDNLISPTLQAMSRSS